MLSLVGRKPKTAEGEQVFNRILATRDERGLSRHDFAEAIGVHYQTIGYLERGEYSPSLVLALRIARVLEVPIEALFSLDPIPETDSATRRTT
jgi:putative transcriptional regulator